MINFRTIKNKLTEAGIDPEELDIIRQGKGIYIIGLKNWGTPLNHQMTGDQVNAKRESDRAQIAKIAEVLEGENLFSFVKVIEEGERA